MKRRALILITILSGVLFLSTLLNIGCIKGYAEEEIHVNVQNILDHVKYLSSDTEFKALQYRVAGTDGEKKAAKYVEEALKKSGLEVKQQSFDFDEVVKENSNIVKFSFKNRTKVNTTNSTIISSKNIDETINGKLVDLGKGTKKDFELKKNQIRGKFILIKLDELTSADYFFAAQLCKLVKGIIIYDPNYIPQKKSTKELPIMNRTVLGDSKIYGEKVMTISNIFKKDYDNLAKKFRNNKEIDISQYVKYNIRKETRHSQNIVATKNCQNKNVDKPLIIVGAHYDCVNVPGAGDNATGAASLIELVRVLSSKKLNYDVKFVAFGAEEIGTFGSNYFVSKLTKDELSRCKLMINLDGAGACNVLLIGKNTGESDDLDARNLACEIAGKNNILYRRFEFTGGDHLNFSQVGISTITFASLEGSNKLENTKDSDWKSFSDLEKENLIDKYSHTSNDTYDVIEKSNKANSNYEKLFKVLLEVFDNYNLSSNYFRSQS